MTPVSEQEVQFALKVVAESSVVLERTVWKKQQDRMRNA